VKAHHTSLRIAVPVALLILSAGRVASAQPPTPVLHGDAAGTIGWLAARSPSAGIYNGRNWLDSLVASASAGWHWTDNLKTEIDFGAGTEIHDYNTQPVIDGGRLFYITTESRFAHRTLGTSQQYQFFHNVWFHPHVAAGANLTWERRTDDIAPISYYQYAGQAPPLPEREGPRTSLTVKPFVAVGFKAYMTERTFFRNDLRVAFHHGISETILRVGFGFDF
jgi:hypothetical protein